VFQVLDVWDALQNLIWLYEPLSHALKLGAEIGLTRKQGERMPLLIGVSISLRVEELP
jgi:hypothetical protein